MQLDSENDRQMLLMTLKEANIKGAYAVPFALLMDRVAMATVVPPAGTEPKPAKTPPRGGVIKVDDA